MKATIGERLLALKERSGLSLAAIANAGGYSAASSIQKVFRPDYNPTKISEQMARKLAKALAGIGHPPIEESELLALAEMAKPLDRFYAEANFVSQYRSKLVLVYPTKVSLTKLVDISGRQVPTFVLDRAKGRPTYECPAHLENRYLQAFTAFSGSLWPRYEEGEVIFFEAVTPARVGDDVIIYFEGSTEDSLDESSVIGRLLAFNDQELELEQFSPPVRHRLNREIVSAVQRILRREELLSPPPTIRFPY